MTQTNMIIFSLFSPLYTHLSMWPSAHKSMHMHIHLLKNAHSTDKSVHTDKVISGWEFRVLVVCGLVTKKQKKLQLASLILVSTQGNLKPHFFSLSPATLYKTASKTQAIKWPPENSTNIVVTIKAYKIRLVLEVLLLDWVSEETEGLC